MKKSLFIMALGAIALTSCSQDEIIEVKQDAIGFSVATENASRATATVKETLNDFVVYANEYGDGGLPYISGVVASRDGEGGGNGEFRLESTYYWPIKPLNFYCISPATFNDGNGSLSPENNVPVINYNVGSDHDEDLLYSVLMQATKGTDGIARINFRHALAMIQFKLASDPTYGLDVEMTNISISNIDNTGVYNLPTETTEGNGEQRGNWTELDEKTNGYSWNVNLSTTDNPNTTEVNETTSDVFFLMPQSFTSADPANGTWSGTYFQFSCVITKNGVKVHEGEVAIPAVSTQGTTEWKEGYKYVYTLKFGQGGGYIPGTENPVVIPISFDVTVDGMKDAAEQEIEVAVPESEEAGE